MSSDILVNGVPLDIHLNKDKQTTQVEKQDDVTKQLTKEMQGRKLPLYKQPKDRVSNKVDLRKEAGAVHHYSKSQIMQENTKRSVQQSTTMGNRVAHLLVSGMWCSTASITSVLDELSIEHQKHTVTCVLSAMVNTPSIRQYLERRVKGTAKSYRWSADDSIFPDSSEIVPTIIKHYQAACTVGRDTKDKKPKRKANPSAFTKVQGVDLQDKLPKYILDYIIASDTTVSFAVVSCLMSGIACRVADIHLTLSNLNKAHTLSTVSTVVSKIGQLSTFKERVNVVISGNSKTFTCVPACLSIEELTPILQEYKDHSYNHQKSLKCNSKPKSKTNASSTPKQEAINTKQTQEVLEGLQEINTQQTQETQEAQEVLNTQQPQETVVVPDVVPAAQPIVTADSTKANEVTNTAEYWLKLGEFMTFAKQQGIAVDLSLSTKDK